MQVRALRTFRDSRGNLRRGAIADFPTGFAKDLIAAKLVEPFAEPAEEDGDADDKKSAGKKKA